MFIDEFFDNGFFQNLVPKDRNNPSFGHIFKTHAYYPHENLEFWRPIHDPSEPTQTIAKAFQIYSGREDAFSKRIPLGAPKLETNEEFLVVRAKIRPVIVVVPEMPFAEVDNTGFRGRVYRRRCLVAQVFGLRDVQSGRAEFSPVFVERVRKMEFPQLLFLPKHSGLFEVDSMLRLDECQSVFTSHLKPTDYSLGPDLTLLLREQLQFLLTGITPELYSCVREGCLKS